MQVLVIVFFYFTTGLVMIFNPDMTQNKDTFNQL